MEDILFGLMTVSSFAGRVKKGRMKMAATMMKLIMIGKEIIIPVMFGMAKFMGMKGLFMGMISMAMKMNLLSKRKDNGGLNFSCGGGSRSLGCSGGLMAMMEIGWGLNTEIDVKSSFMREDIYILKISMLWVKYF
jgi:hypothetical protein